jgi:transcription-repair coupling factor (superfamily II helicase)
LAEAVEDVKQAQAEEKMRKILEPQVPTVVLPLAAYIPEEYVSDLSTRLNFYQRLAAVKQVQEIEGIAVEISDRFGPVPQEVKNLLYAVEIKQLASVAMAGSISTEDRQIVLNFSNARELNKLSLDRDLKSGVRVGSQRIKLDIKLLGHSWQDVLREVLHKVTANI